MPIKDYSDPRILLYHMLKGVLKDLESSDISVVLGAHQFLCNDRGVLRKCCKLFNVDWNKITDWYMDLTKHEVRTLINDFDDLYKELTYETKSTNTVSTRQLENHSI